MAAQDELPAYATLKRLQPFGNDAIGTAALEFVIAALALRETPLAALIDGSAHDSLNARCTGPARPDSCEAPKCAPERQKRRPQDDHLFAPQGLIDGQT
jgi:hypothetical protein